MSKRPCWLLCIVGLSALLTACAGSATFSTSTTRGEAVGVLEPTTSSSVSTPIEEDRATTAESIDDDVSILILYETQGFTHESIPAGIEAFELLSSELGFEMTATDDSERFTSDELSSHDVVVYLNTTGDVLDADQQAAMEGFIASGGGFIGIHSAADTEYEWPWYGELVGAYFDSHPAVQPAVVEVIEPAHPIVAGLTPRFERTDEWYNYANLPGPDVEVLMTVDETTYEGGSMGEPHPIAWAQEFDGGRAFYTGFGHTSESFAEPMFLRMLANAVQWVAGE